MIRREKNKMINKYKSNNNSDSSLIDNDIVNMYKTGYSIKYIAKSYYKYINKKQKPIKIDGVMYFPPKIYNMEYCKMYVTEIIYNFCKNSYASTKIS